MPLNHTGFDTIEYFYLTDFYILAKAMDLGLRPIEYRTWQYVNSCYVHGVEVDTEEACAYLEISLCEFLAIVAVLMDENLLPDNQILGETNNEFI